MTRPVSGRPASSDPLAQPAQAALDAVFGPGRSIVTATATYRDSGTRLTRTYDPKRVAVLSRATSSGPGYAASDTTNGSADQ